MKTCCALFYLNDGLRLPDNKEEKREAICALFCWRRMNGSLNEASVSLPVETEK